MEDTKLSYPMQEVSVQAKEFVVFRGTQIYEHQLGERNSLEGFLSEAIRYALAQYVRHDTRSRGGQ